MPLGRPTREHEDLLLLIGSSYDRVAAALTVLEGTFLRRSQKPGTTDPQEYSVFRHPTLREGFAAFMASNPNWLEIFIAGLDDDGVLTQLDCGSGDTRGTLHCLPPTLYRTVAERAAQPGSTPSRQWENRGARFQRGRRSWPTVARRISWKLYLETDEQALNRCLNFGSSLSAIPELPVLAKLHKCGLLSEENLRGVEAISELAVDTPDADWLGDPDATGLLTSEDRAEILAHVKGELIPDLEYTLYNWGATSRETAPKSITILGRCTQELCRCVPGG